MGLVVATAETGGIALGRAGLQSGGTVIASAVGLLLAYLDLIDAEGKRPDLSSGLGGLVLPLLTTFLVIVLLEGVRYVS